MRKLRKFRINYKTKILFLNRLAILNKYQIHPERFNKLFRRNLLKFLNFRVFSLERSVPGCQASRPSQPLLKPTTGPLCFLLRTRFSF